MLSSDDHEFVLPIRSPLLQNKQSRRRKVKVRHPATRRILNFETATVTGNCLWKVWSDYYLGTPYSLSTVGDHNPGWIIRSIELYDDYEDNHVD